ncbi:MAG: MarR family transcriptional regulator [Thermodesulfobacteriota bacterium]|jgi:DNA-binding MarR family transcriptional regulator|nr:MAG: MarR family transcriptional regulator [Thermodesulfobacteriota bacterium]
MVKNSQQISEIIDSLRRVFQAVNEYSKKVKAQTGLTGPQLWTIKVVAEFSSIKVSDLARRMYLHPATVVGIIDRLEAKGLVSRVRSRNDRRVVWVSLTPQGEELISQAPEVAQGLLVAGLEALPSEEQRTIGEVLSQLVKILKAQEFPPKLMFSHEVNEPQK